jgi:signal transduction histidine kinase
MGDERIPMSAMLQIFGLAGGTAAVVGLLGYVAVRMLARRSVAAAAVAVPVTMVAAFVIGLVATSEAMFLSGHDLIVALLVCAAAGLVSLVVGLALGTGVRRMQQEAAQQVATLQREAQVEASRRDLVAWVSHDLRTPLAGLRAMAEALEDGVAEDPVRYHRQMRIAVDRLSTLVDDLFELSRINAGALQLTFEDVSVDELVSDAVAAAYAQARARGVQLAGRSSTGRLVSADEGRLHRVLTNLVLNAVRHTPKDGVVRVDATQTPDRVVLAVTDGCGGIPDTDLPHLFDVAWRGTAARTPGPDSGAGLGLAIVRGIVEVHRGEVTVRNVAGGCCFEVVLPASSASPA